MIDAVVQHEGIGMVVGYEDDGTALVIGKKGKTKSGRQGKWTARIPSRPTHHKAAMAQLLIEKAHLAD